MENLEPLLLRNCRLASGRDVDVLLQGGKIAGLSSPGEHPFAGTERDLRGHLLLPSLVEPHCHLDKAFTDRLIGSPAGDVAAASRAWHDFRSRIDFDAVAERASTAIEYLVGNGVTAIRTHVDVGAASGTRFVEVMDTLRQRYHNIVDMKIVAFVDNPLIGNLGLHNRKLLNDSFACGADVIGGAPYQNGDWLRFQRYCLELGRRWGRGIDFHMDETIEARVFTLRRLIDQARKVGLPISVNASHCVSLASQRRTVIASVADALAETGISIVTLPLCNLFLQGRDVLSRKPRGLAPLQTLIDRGVTVAAGGDNYQDPFNPVGRCDPLETASILVTAGHLSPEQALECVTSNAREVMGLPPVKVAPGYPADLLAICAKTPREAIGFASPRRSVFRGGQLVASASYQRRFYCPGDR